MCWADDGSAGRKGSSVLVGPRAARPGDLARPVAQASLVVSASDAELDPGPIADRYEELFAELDATRRSRGRQRRQAWWHRPMGRAVRRLS
jgi:hypothetical protein